jgi:hypothetical protein
MQEQAVIFRPRRDRLQRRLELIPINLNPAVEQAGTDNS